jgi:tRNA(Ile2) C34 agmatinyltransferase TiaS
MNNPDAAMKEVKPNEVVSDAEKIARASTYCPNCSAKLEDSGCKMKCRQCGFYLSCSDFY